jgi:hypothetical protein
MRLSKLPANQVFGMFRPVRLLFKHTFAATMIQPIVYHPQLEETNHATKQSAQHGKCSVTVVDQALRVSGPSQSTYLILSPQQVSAKVSGKMVRHATLEYNSLDTSSSYEKKTYLGDTMFLRWQIYRSRSMKEGTAVIGCGRTGLLHAGTIKFVRLHTSSAYDVAIQRLNRTTDVVVVVVIGP